MGILKSIAVLLLFLWSVALVPALGESIDDSPEVVSEYAKGKRYLREGNWLEASRTFETLAGRFPNSRNIDLFVFNRARAEFHFGDFPKALAGFSSFVSRFSTSPYVPHARYFIGNIHYVKGQLNRAVASWIEAYGLSNEPRLSDLVTRSLVNAVERAESAKLGAADFAAVPQARRCALIEPLAEALVRREAYQSAQELMALCDKTIDLPTGTTAPTGAFGQNLELAVVLPFSGEMQTFGEEIHNGAIIAAEAYRQETGRNLKLVPYDTKGDPINTARIMKELVDSQVDAVVGPLTSEEAAVASAVLNCGNLPMIAPAATQAGLTLLSESAFQLSPNIELQGIQMAEYAVLNRGADSAAIITSTSTDHLRTARAFADRFKQLGGTVVAIEYYRTRDKDFGDYVQDVKAMLLGVHPDSAFFVNERGDTLDADGIPAYIDCLFLPGTPQQLRLLLPQINFYNLNAFYLGTDGWGDQAVYRLGDNITKQAVFPSPFLQEQMSEEFLRFAAAYDLRFGTRPRRLASLGYDAVRVIALAVSEGASSREDLVDRLGRISKYQGAAAEVTFGGHRENVELPLYRIVDGGAEYLGGAETGAPAPEETPEG
ncbi:MAG: ABC transporter substrate-binding protein [bacterium]|nr:ABC transporter substrate-binding protein [bacterium]